MVGVRVRVVAEGIMVIIVVVGVDGIREARVEKHEGGGGGGGGHRGGSDGERVVVCSFVRRYQY